MAKSSSIGEAGQAPSSQPSPSKVSGSQAIRRGIALTYKALLITALVIFVTEILLLTLLNRFFTAPTHALSVSAALLALLILIPTLYFIYHRPLLRRIAEMELARDAIRESEQLFRTVVTNSQPIIFMIDRQGDFILSEGKMLSALGLTPGQVVGQSAYEIYKDFPDIIRGLDSALAGEHYVDIIDVGGAFFDVFYSPVHNSLGEVTGLIGMAVDITDRKRAEQERLELERQVQHAQKLESLGVLAGGIAHDFNNLLMGILGNADLALQDLSPVSPVREYLENITQTSRRAAELAKQMLAYSGKGKFVIGSIGINELIDEISHLLAVTIAKSVTLKFNLAEGLPTFEGDATQIRQVLMNLIINASESIGDKSGIVTVTTGAMDCDHAYLDKTEMVALVALDDPLPEGQYIYLEVADTGSGMDRETLAKIFDPFFTTKFTGRGLGMAAVLGIVRSHDGTIKINSEPGRGSTLRVLFPAKAAAGREETAPVEPRESGDWCSSGTILVVDDDETVRSLARRMLERQGYDVITACDGQEAVDLFAERGRDISCVLLDLTMPKLDGEACFRELRRIDPRVRVIMSSGYNEQEVIQRFAGKGVVGFIQKPYAAASLNAKVRETLSSDEARP